MVKPQKGYTNYIYYIDHLLGRAQSTPICYISTSLDLTGLELD